MITQFFISFAIAIATAIILSVGWYGISVWKHRNDVADIGWGTYFIGIAVIIFMIHNPFIDFRFIPLILVLIWGIRLSKHIYRRHKASSDEDKRYQTWRKQWGNGTYFKIRSYLQVFLLQSFLAVIIALPIIIMQTFGARKAELIPFAIGLAVWIIGFIIEQQADKQLKKFLAQKTKEGPQIIATGLWKYSRHPNYFGEATQWWGLWIMTIGLPMWWIAIIGPIVITTLLRFVSGVPLAEKSMGKVPGFAEYKKTTNAFIPWLPRKAK